MLSAACAPPVASGDARGGIPFDASKPAEDAKSGASGDGGLQDVRDGEFGDAAGGLDGTTERDSSDAPPSPDAEAIDGPSAEADAPDTGGIGTLWASPGLPPWDAPTLAHVHSVRASGTAMGNSGTVFAKMGDSITEYPPFLYEIGNGNYQLGAYGALAATISQFTSTTLYDGSNSFNRYSDAAQAGWTSADALGPPDAVTLEISEIHPAYAIVMFGTNDLETDSVATYSGHMDTLVSQAESAGVVVVLSTIPDREDLAQGPQLVAQFNQAIMALAASRHLPLVDLFAALSSLPGQGLGPDQIHPSVEPLPDGGTTPADFTSAGLQYGFDVRNLLTVQALDRLRQIP